MAGVTTERILADKVLQKTCGQECVDWAIRMLEEGYDGECLSRLWGMVPPFNHFEIASLRDHALAELGIHEIAPSVALSRYATEILSTGLSGEIELVDAISIVKDLCLANDYQDDLFDFYELYFAYADLEEEDFSYYCRGATRESILEIIRERAHAFVRGQPPNG